MLSSLSRRFNLKEPVIRAAIEGILIVGVIWAFAVLWGPTIGLVYPTSGTPQLLMLYFFIYVLVRGIFLARKAAQAAEMSDKNEDA